MKYLIIIIVLLSPISHFFVNAEDNGISDSYVSIINNNRVWEYHKVRQRFDGYYHWLFYMKFDGEEIRQGRTYHVFTFCGNEIQWTCNEVGIYNDDISITPNAHFDRFLIREEDKRIYLYNDLTINTYPTAFDTLEELILYDFNLNLNEKFMAMTLIYKYPDGYLYGENTLFEHEIYQLDYINVEGQKCAVQYLTDTVPGIFAIEGIGCVDYGILPIYNLLDYVTGTQDYYSLNRVYNTKGEIIFSNPDWCQEIPTSIDILKDEIDFTYINGTLEVRDLGHMISAKIFNLNGEVLMAADGYDSVQMDTEELNPGIYIAKAGHKTLKLVVR